MRVAAPEALGSQIEVGKAFAPPPLPLAAVTPVVDGLALLGALAITVDLDRLGLVYSVVVFLILLISGSYRSRIDCRLGADIPYLIPLLALPCLAVAPLASSADLRGFMLEAVPLAILFVLAGRGLVYKLIREARAHGYIRERTVIVGAGAVGVRLAKTLMEHPDYGLVPLGFLDSFVSEALVLPILGRAEELEAIVLGLAVRRVIVAFGAIGDREIASVLRTCDRLPVEVYVIPRLFELGVNPEGPTTEEVWGIPLIRLRRAALRTVAWRTKRIFDLVTGSLLLLVTSPLFVMAALAIRLTSRGPILFRQRRVGQYGHIFELLKFRTIRREEEPDTAWSVDEDRYTSVGWILRRTSLDELPQLINVVRGDMSLVGPRPERPYFVDQFRVTVQGYDARHRVPTGLTGWAQVHGLRGDTSIEERAIFDNHYVEHWSLWRDMVILVRTIMVVLKLEGR